MQFKLSLRANGGDNADGRTTIINASHSLIRYMVTKSVGKIIYDTDNLHLVTLLKIYLNIQMIMLAVWQKIVYGI